MPVTARLSKQFYDRFGDDVVAELVEWMNQVDAASHSSLRELNDLNFARFDATLGQRLAALSTEMHVGLATLETTMHGGLATLEAKMQGGYASLETKMQAGYATLETKMIRWMVGLWIAQTALFVTILLQLR